MGGASLSERLRDVKLPMSRGEVADEVDVLAAERDRLAEFARWAIQNSAFEGCDLGGDEVQYKAVELGLIEETAYDPDQHGPNVYVVPGDQWFVFSAALTEPRP